MPDQLPIRTVNATRYVTPLREGGSMPAIVEADDDGIYVLKFRGAAQGPKALIAELVSGEIGRALGLPVPEIVRVQLDPALGRNEPDPDIKDLLEASPGLNLGLDYLPGSMPFDLLVRPKLAADFASAVVWFDAYISNVDRTPRNTNMLLWHKQPWLIDHGASLFFHYNWDKYLEKSRSPFRQIKDHVLLPYAREIAAAGERLREQLTPERLAQIVASIPDEWLGPDPQFAGPEQQREAYLAYLLSRLEASAVFVEEAMNARAQLV